MPTTAAWTRRGLLLAGAAGLIGLGGCAITDPTVESTAGSIGIGGASASASEPPSPDLVRGADAEADDQVYRAIAGHAGAWHVPTGVAAWATAVAAVRTAHASLLAQVDPLSGRNGDKTARFAPRAASTPKLASWTAAQATITTNETALATGHKARAVAATSAPMALLWASLATSAHSRIAVRVLPVSTNAAPIPFDPGTRTDALEVLLGHVDALIYALQVGLGQLPSGDSDYASGQQRLAQVLALRDSTAAALTAASATPSAASLRYRMPNTMSNHAQIVSAWAQFESLLLDAWGRVCAASSGTARAQAIDQMFAQADRAQALGQGLSAYPGWV